MGSGPIDYLIIGAGPAGLQLAQELGAAGYDYLVLESGSGPGTFFTRFPRHRQLISINKPHTGTDDPELRMRMDWNSILAFDDKGPLFTTYSERYFPQADDLLRYLSDYARRYELRIDYDTTVTRVSRAPAHADAGADVDADADADVDADAGDFAITDSRGRTHRARRVIAATGVSKPYIPPIPGIELAEQYWSVTTDPKEFIDQRVLIIGKGNSALETADNLTPTAAVIHVAGPSPMRFAWKTHYVGHLRAVNNNFLDTYQLKSQNAILDGTVQSIERDEAGSYAVRFSFSRANEFVKEIRYDRVIDCTGFRFDAEIFDPGCRPVLIHKDRFPRLTSAYEAEGVPGLYVAGTPTQVRDFKHGTSGFIHGFRYGARALRKILGARYHQTPWPSAVVRGTAEEITEAILARVNRSSGLYQQFAVLGDVVLRPATGDAAYLEEVPVDYALDELAGGAENTNGPDMIIVTLEYGPDHDKVDPFDITVARVAQDDAEHAFDAAYLHPVVRLYRDGRLIDSHHVAENLENEWDKPAHRDPLVAFLTVNEPSIAPTPAR
ncbi:pyridine nucleotide-disulfide oxidoreductase [Microlunatus endophyticus]|uniref:Pyridine nucleotide-disulfide oxidoreductase n=1 Tax=Microlunatus endophyticus TaxID=1716077 RepID=A0A917S4S5_9ACTN|nr:NAD(P)-binding domain-containing protein [Microlunatus endophyticus]GGL58344.1 pyridine nucleotide-disulfide oxidoreductase [Microlunatus endophyticus]